MIAMVVVALVSLLLALAWEERAYQRAARRQWDSHPHPGRCLCCDGGPRVDDMPTHTRLVHAPRDRGPEDSPQWAAQ